MGDNRYAQAADEALDEIRRARQKHGPKDFNSGHEGYAVLLEEVDELWDHVRADTWKTNAARKEAIQIAAMALRYAAELTDGG